MGQLSGLSLMSPSYTNDPRGALSRRTDELRRGAGGRHQAARGEFPPRTGTKDALKWICSIAHIGYVSSP